MRLLACISKLYICILLVFSIPLEINIGHFGPWETGLLFEMCIFHTHINSQAFISSEIAPKWMPGSRSLSDDCNIFVIVVVVMFLLLLFMVVLMMVVVVITCLYYLLGGYRGKRFMSCHQVVHRKLTITPQSATQKSVALTADCSRT